MMIYFSIPGQKKQLHAQSQPQQSKEPTRKARVSSDKDIEKQHLSTPLYDEVDVFDEPLEHQQIIPYDTPHYEKTDRLDSAAGYLYEDVVEDIWDKHDASGLVHYTDAAFWDRLAGDLDERAHDGWDVEEDSGEDSVSSWESVEHDPATSAAAAEHSSMRSQCLRNPHGTNFHKSHLPVRKKRGRREGLDQSSGFAGVRSGVAGSIMRRWGSACSASSSDILLAVLDGQQPNKARTGLGWVGKMRHHSDYQQGAAEACPGTWVKIGSVFDSARSCDPEMPIRQSPPTPSRRVAGSFRLSQGADRCGSIVFVAAVEDK